MSDPLHLLLVEDDELFRLGLRVRLQQETDIDRIVEAEDGETAITLASETSFDLVILDIGLPGIGGMETCRQLKDKYPELPILILTSRDNPELITRFIQAGVQGYCLKGIAAETLILAVRSIASGASWWDAIATQKIRQTLATSNVLFNSSAHVDAISKNPLTQREQEVLTLIAQSKTNPEIAQILYISPGTVRVHMHTILHKLAVNDRSQAVRLAQQANWIPET